MQICDQSKEITNEITSLKTETNQPQTNPNYQRITNPTLRDPTLRTDGLHFRAVFSNGARFDFRGSRMPPWPSWRRWVRESFLG